MGITDLKNIRKLKVLKSLLILDKYDEIGWKYNHLIDPKSYSNSGANIIYNIECLKNVFELKNYGECIEIITQIIEALNSRVFTFKCEKKWRDLERTKDNNTRFCMSCSRHVFEVNNEVDYNKRKHLQQCVFFSQSITNESEIGICVVDVADEEEEWMGILPTSDMATYDMDKLLPFKRT